MLDDALKQTRGNFFGRVANLLGATQLTDDIWDEIEATLIQADLGIETALHVSRTLREVVRTRGLTTHEQLASALRDTLIGLLPSPDDKLGKPGDRLLTVILIVGVNGSGKTTTVGKLSQKLMAENWQIMVVAADTYRAAAIDQLQTWGERTGVPVIAGQPGGDPGAVTYDGIRATRARKRDLLIIDTAGRLHTKYNLMEELKKVRSVAAKNVHDAPHEVWLVVDGTTGQNAIAQARQFSDAVGVTGVIVTKLDGSAKGGMVFAIGHELRLPVRYIGVGEGAADLLAFEPQSFVDSLLA